VVRRDGGRRGRWLPPGAAPPQVPAFQVVPRRWVVERSFAWLGRSRRLARDYEFCPATSEAVIYLAASQLLVRRLAGVAPPASTAGSGRRWPAATRLPPGRRPAAAALAQQRSQPPTADLHPTAAGQPRGQLPRGPDLPAAGGLAQQLLDRVQILVAEPRWAASPGAIRQPVQSTGHNPPQRPPHGRLADRQLLGDLGHGPALVAELHALQADPQAGRHRGLAQPPTQLGLLVRGQPETRSGSGHDTSMSHHQPQRHAYTATTSFSDTL
jgi:Transposase DDE domain